MGNKEVQNYVLLAIFILLLYISYLILKPFLAALLASFFLTYLLYPIYQWLNNIIKKDYISSTITTLLMVILVFLPFVVIITIIFRETVNIYNSGSLDQITNLISSVLKNPDVEKQVMEAVLAVVNALGKGIADFVLNIPMMIIAFLVMILTTFYLFMNAKAFMQIIKRAIPFKHKDELINHIADTTYSISYGFFVIALLAFIISAIGFALIGINNPFIWGVLVGFAALLPIIGPFLIVFVPLMLIELAKHSYYTIISLALLYLIIGYLENILRPKIIGDKSKTQPVIIIIGMLGGLELFGFIGVIVGPIILSMMVIIIEDYYYEYIKD